MSFSSCYDSLNCRSPLCSRTSQFPPFGLGNLEAQSGLYAKKKLCLQPNVYLRSCRNNAWALSAWQYTGRRAGFHDIVLFLYKYHSCCLTGINNHCAGCLLDCTSLLVSWSYTAALERFLLTQKILWYIMMKYPL